jgi:hypothetical protein
MDGVLLMTRTVCLILNILPGTKISINYRYIETMLENQELDTWTLLQISRVRLMFEYVGVRSSKSSF